MMQQLPALRDPQKAHKPQAFYGDIPTLLGFMIRGVYMGYPYPNFCLCAFLGPPPSFEVSCLVVRG